MEGAAAWTRFIQPSSSIALSNPSVARWMSLSLPLSAAWTKKAPAASPVRTPEECSWQVLRERVIGIKERFQAADRTTLWGNEVRELLVPVHRYPTLRFNIALSAKLNSPPKPNRAGENCRADHGIIMTGCQIGQSAIASPSPRHVNSINPPASGPSPAR